MGCRYPEPLKAVRFVVNSLSFSHFNIARADIPCVLGNGVRGAPQSAQSITLYISVNITPNLHNSSPDIPIEVLPTERTTVPGRIQFLVPEHLSLLSPHQPVETGNAMPQSREEESHTVAKNPRPALNQADEAMDPIDGSNAWERAVGRIKWVMDTLSPIAEVSIIPVDFPG